MSTPQLPSTISNSSNPPSPTSVDHRPKSTERKGTAGSRKQFGDSHGSDHLPSMGLTQNSKESPLVQGQYEKQLLTKLENLHKQGYTPKLKKPKPLRNKSEWRDTVPQPPGRHISQRDTVGINMAHPPLERSNMMDTKDLRLGRLRGNRLLLKFEKSIGREENFDNAIDALVESRMYYQEAKEYGKVADVSALLARKHGDRAASELAKARKARDYGACSSHCAEALHYYKVLADLTFLERDLAPGEVARREKDKAMFREFTSPHQCARRYAIEDGEESMAAALSMLNYDLEGAAAAASDAKRCFEWLARDEEDRVLQGYLKFVGQTGSSHLIQLQDIQHRISVATLATGGDTDLESATSKLMPYFYLTCDTPKDAAAIEKQIEASLQQAHESYTAAGDAAGVEVVVRVRRCVHHIKLVNKYWFGLVEALKVEDYAMARLILENLRSELVQATTGLPSINTAVDTLLKIVATTNTDASVMIVQFALDDGIASAKKAKQLLKEANQDINKQAALVNAAKRSERAQKSLSYASVTASPAPSPTTTAKLNSTWGEEMITQKEEADLESINDEVTESDTAARMETYTQNWEKGFSLEGAIEGSALLQRFFVSFPELQGPKVPLESQRKDRHRQAMDALKDLDKFDKLLAKKTAFEDARTKVATFLESPDFCEGTAGEKLGLLESAIDGFRGSAFEAEAQVVESLYRCRLGDMLFEQASAIHGPKRFTSESIISARETNMSVTERSADFDEAIGRLKKAKLEYESGGDMLAASKMNIASSIIQGDKLASPVCGLLNQTLYSEALEALEASKNCFDDALREEKGLECNKHATPLWWSPDSALASLLRTQGDNENSRFAPKAQLASTCYGGADLKARRACCSGPRALICSRARGDGHSFKAKALQIVAAEDGTGNLEEASRVVDLARDCFRWAVGVEPDKPPVRPGAEDEDDPEGKKRWRRSCADRGGYKGGDELVLECEEAVSMAEEYWKGGGLLAAAKNLLSTLDLETEQSDKLDLEKASEIGVESRNESIRCLELAKSCLDRSGGRFVNMLEARAEVDDEIRKHQTGVTTQSAKAAYGCQITPQECASKEAILLEQLCVVYFDGAAVEECERLLQCLAADADCSTVQQLTRSKLFADAASVLARSKAVFEKAEDMMRCQKMERAEEMVDELRLHDQAVMTMKYDEAVVHLKRASAAVHSLPLMKPRTLVCGTPSGLSVHGGPLGLPDPPLTVVVKLAIKTGVADCELASQFLAQSSFDQCREAIARSRASFDWYRSQEKLGFEDENNSEERKRSTRNLHELEVAVEASHAAARGDKALKACLAHLEASGVPEEVYSADKLVDRDIVEDKLIDSSLIDSPVEPKKSVESTATSPSSKKSKNKANSVNEGPAMLVVTASMLLEAELLLPQMLGGQGPGWQAAAVSRGNRAAAALEAQDTALTEKLLDEAEKEFILSNEGGGKFSKNAAYQLSTIRQIRTRCQATALVAKARVLFNERSENFQECVATIKEALEKFDDSFGDLDEGAKEIQSCERFLSRVSGDEVTARYRTALAAREYSAALELLREATALYQAAFPPPVGVEVVAAPSSPVLSGSSSVGSDAPLVPPTPAAIKNYYIPDDCLQVVRVQAIKDGDQAKRRGSNALQNLEDTVSARNELKVASLCYSWAEVSPEERGVSAVEEEIHLFEMRKAAEHSSEASFLKFKDGKYKQALELMQKAHEQYEQACEKKKSAELKEVVNMLHAADNLSQVDAFGMSCVDRVNQRRPETPLYDIFESEKKPFSVAQAAKPAFVALAAVRSSGLRKWSSAAAQCVDQLQQATEFLLSLQTFQTHLLDKPSENDQLISMLNKDIEALVLVAAACHGLERPGLVWSLPLRLRTLDVFIEAAKLTVKLLVPEPAPVASYDEDDFEPDVDNTEVDEIEEVPDP